jgi:peptidoglycan/LPS O-acetylase OafA/YrhL
VIGRWWAARRPFRRSSERSAESGFVSPLTQSAGFRTDIEGLRGVAVLLVVLYHAGVPGFSGGFVGVDVFFVLSGYLITGLLIRELERTGGVNLREFYARRARRLLPASALVLVATMLASSLVFSPIEQSRIARTAFTAATYVSNMWFAWRSMDYFAGSSETDPLLHTWSLSVEEQFYLVWPVLILLAMRGRGSRSRLLAVMAGLSLVSFVGAVRLTGTHPAWAFYAAPARAWEFGLGGLASLLPVSAVRAWPAANRALGWLGLLMIVAATLSFSVNTSFPGVAALLPVVGTLAVLVAGPGAPATGVARLLAFAPLQRMGMLSYSWYLWHWPVLVLTAAVLPGLSLPGRLLCVFGSLGLAAVTYHTVERPIRFHRGLSLRPAFSLWFAALLTVSGGGVALGWRHAALQARESPRHQMFEQASRDRDQLGPCNALWGDEDAEPCLFGDSASSVLIGLLGDSHAAHWFPALEVVARERGWQLVTLTKHACPAAAVPVADPRYHDPGECTVWRADALDRIRDLDPDVVVLGSAAAFYPGLTGADWRAGFRATLGALDEAGIPALVLWGTPAAGEELPVCLSRAVVQRRDPNRSCALDPVEALDPTSYLAALEVASHLEDVLVLDLSDQFCDGAVCRPIVDGSVLLHDSHHLTASRARSVAPVLSARLAELLSAFGAVDSSGATPAPRACSGAVECLAREADRGEGRGGGPAGSAGP